MPEPDKSVPVDALIALAEAIQVMDRLRSPGGCPWDAEQTHRSLAKYAIEEAFEVAEAAETDNLPALQEELGDLLLQVLFHARIASETDAFTLGDIATTLVEKLRRRHPHVFGDVTAHTPAEVERNWDAVKQSEKKRAHPLDDIPTDLPALMRAQKLMSRATKAGLDVSVGDHGQDVDGMDSPAEIGQQLLQLSQRATSDGIDAEQALREATRGLETRLRTQ